MWLLMKASDQNDELCNQQLRNAHLQKADTVTLSVLVKLVLALITPIE